MRINSNFLLILSLIALFVKNLEMQFLKHVKLVLKSYNSSKLESIMWVAIKKIILII